MSIFTSILTGGSNNHETTAEAANAVATDLLNEGVVGAITNTSGVAPATGAFAVNAQGTPDMTVAVTAGVAYVTATPTGQNSQNFRVRSTAEEDVTIAANSSGSTKYDWIYIKIDPDDAANPAVNGDDVATLVVSRSTSAASDDGTPPTYGYAIAVVTVANAASSITNGNITDKRVVAGVDTDQIANDSVTAEKIDWASTGADGGIWWEEIGRTTLTPAGDTITVSSLPSRKFLKVYASLTSTGGTITPKLVLNNDTASASYNRRVSDNHGASSASAGSDLFLTDAASANMQYVVIDIVNVAAQNKLLIAQGMTDGGDGAAPSTRELVGQWEDSTNIISRIDLVNGGTGDFAVGSEVVVLGHN